MEETVTFEKENGEYIFTVKSEFLKKIDLEAIKKAEIYDLFNDHGMANYLHNPNGPGVYDTVAQFGEYWINGKRIDDEAAKKIIHNKHFNEKVDVLLNEETTKE